MIRLQRVGKKNRPSFRLILVEKARAARTGDFKEILGSVDRIEKRVQLNTERITHWLQFGVQPSATAHNLLVNAGILEGKKQAVHSRHASKKTIERRKANPPAGGPSEVPVATPVSEAPVGEPDETPTAAEPVAEATTEAHVAKSPADELVETPAP